MTTSTRAAFSIVILAALLASTGCKPARSGTTEAPAQAAPAQDDLAPPAEINATQGAHDVDPEAPSFTVAGLVFARPEGWSLIAPGTMRAAELKNAGIPEASIVFTHFGAHGAGAVADNLTRWARQVVDDSGEPTLPEMTQAMAEVDGVTRTITLARYTGTYTSAMPGRPSAPAPDTLFLGAIVEGGPQGPVYMRAFGPKDALAPHVPAILAMLMNNAHETAP